ncbi:hypothetical protein Bca101_025560 [Brassica carinata]
MSNIETLHCFNVNSRTDGANAYLFPLVSDLWSWKSNESETMKITFSAISPPESILS